MLHVAGEVLARADDVEPVHLAAVDRVQPRRETVRDVVRLDVRRRLQRDIGAGNAPVVGALQGPTLGRAVGSGVGAEVVVESPVLLDDEDHVLDRVLAGNDHTDVPVALPLAPAVPLARLRRARGVGALAPCRPELPDEEEAHHHHDRHEGAASRDLLAGWASRGGRADDGTGSSLHDAGVYPCGCPAPRRSASRAASSSRTPAYLGSCARLCSCHGSDGPSAPPTSYSSTHPPSVSM